MKRTLLKPWLYLTFFCGALALAGIPVVHAEPETAEVEEQAEAEEAEETDKDEAEEQSEENGKEEGTDNEQKAESADPELSQLARERSRLETLNAIAAAKLHNELKELREEKARIEAELELTTAQRNRERRERQDAIALQKLEIEEITHQSALAAAELKSSLREELAELQAAKERVDLETSIAVSEANASIQQAKADEVKMQSRLMELRTEMAEKDAAADRRSYAGNEPVYLKDPVLEDGTLVISDRRISLNGAITTATADYITERINYFNNSNTEYPIFIVIDYSPGGSVMAGYRILKAMESSDAPVHVVVKSFAASMAAAITTLAEESYAYPNAILLHHQLSSVQGGNLTVMREGVEAMEQWWVRLAQPIADKMEISLDEFIKQMYANASTGDWSEFADVAVDLKWVNQVIPRARETSLLRNPDAIEEKENAARTRTSGLEEQKDDKGPYIMLPRLQPYDAWFLHNPDGYYRAP